MQKTNVIDGVLEDVKFVHVFLFCAVWDKVSELHDFVVYAFAAAAFDCGVTDFAEEFFFAFVSWAGDGRLYGCGCVDWGRGGGFLFDDDLVGMDEGVVERDGAGC